MSYYKLIEKLEIVKVQDFGSEFRGGIFSPPVAEKCVRTILRIARLRFAVAKLRRDEVRQEIREGDILCFMYIAWKVRMGFT